jgi:hypothetical protein
MKKIHPEKGRVGQERVSSRRPQSARPPKDWPGIPGRSADHEAEFDDGPAQVTEAQRDLERHGEHHEPA